MSRLYIKLIENNANGIYNVGTEVKTMSDLAKQTKFDVEWCYIRREGSIPNNVTMSIDKMNKLLQK